MENYDEIIYDDSPELVTTVSELRHYVNCHGITNKLCSYFKCKSNLINKICNNCFGSSEVKTLVNNTSLIKDEIDTREEIENAKNAALIKNNELINILSEKRTTFCGIGTNKIKRRLNTLSKTSILAKIYRLALEIEDKNIQAKNSIFIYRDKIYDEKEKIIVELIDIFKENNLIYGYQQSDVNITSKIIYFEIENCEQISFHSNCNLILPKYENEWDGKINSTLEKLENGILKSFNNINHN